jgi:GTP-binding protein
MGTASLSQFEDGEDITPLFDTILEHIPAPEGDETAGLQMLISSIDYNEYVGRIGVGRIERGTIKTGQQATITDFHGSHPDFNSKIVTLYQIDGLVRTPVSDAKVGDIVWISGIENISIGDTVCSTDCVEPVEFVKISEPTVEMTFSVNDSPFAGREGKFVTSRQLRDRLYREILRDVSLHVSDTDTTDSFLVKGRGEMHLSVLIETMRREGFEFSVSPPRVIFEEIDGALCEPIERLYIDVPIGNEGAVMEKLGTRKAELQAMGPNGSRMKMEFKIPSRGLFGYKSEFLTDTKGEGIMNSVFEDYEPYRGDIPKRLTGSLVAFETGDAVTYGLFNAQERGKLFIGAGTPVYEGMIVGECPKAEDLVVNVCKKKHLTNTRASGSDDALRLVTPVKFSLEDSLEFISDDELMEVTPKTIRLRKRIMNNQLRAKSNSK